VLSKESYGYLRLCEAIDKVRREKESVIVAIDGNSAAGKTSLAALLKETYACNVFSMDDFFLRPAQRTPERLLEPGGNIDYERFSLEIIAPLTAAAPFSYRPYDCQSGGFKPAVQAARCGVNVFEGVYSLHPRFFDVYDLRVFLSLDETEQRSRLASRNEALYERFINEWIPMENRYFEHFDIPGRSGLVFDARDFAPDI